MKVLIVDDEPLARERLARLLEKIPEYEPATPWATNGVQALELIEKLKPDVVLLDIRMPGMDYKLLSSYLNKQRHQPLSFVRHMTSLH